MELFKNVSELSKGETIDSKIFKLPTDDDDATAWPTSGSTQVDFVDGYDISVKQDKSGLHVYIVYIQTTVTYYYNSINVII